MIVFASVLGGGLKSEDWNGKGVCSYSVSWQGLGLHSMWTCQKSSNVQLRFVHLI